MNTVTLTLGCNATNCYLVYADGSDTCAVIDPGDAPETVTDKVRELGLTVEAILLTHGHFDHVGAVKALAEATGCAVWMHEGDYRRAPNPINAYLFPIARAKLASIRLCGDGDELAAGGLRFRVLATPGHTAGSVCYLCGDALFSGDTLFAGTCGRTDLPGGSAESLRASLIRLKTVSGIDAVYPGHGASTRFSTELRYNPYLRGTP